MRIQLVLVVSLLCAGCGAPSYELPPAQAPSQEDPTGGASETSSAPSVDESEPAGEQGEGVTWARRADASRVLILQTTKLDRYAEVLGPIDIHESMGSEAAALERLRERAADMGADAVVGVEFHHGDAPGEPTHLSGLAVRYVAPPELPMH